VSNPTLNCNLKDIWTSICLELQQVVSPDAVSRWFHPLTLQAYSKNSLTLSSDNSIYRYWIEENYLPQLVSTASRVLGESVTIVFLSDGVTAPSLEGAGPTTDVSPK
jgi:chromosomal replication initiator protein